MVGHVSCVHKKEIEGCMWIILWSNSLPYGKTEAVQNLEVRLKGSNQWDK